ncbi:MAG: hypothetical protein V1800_09900 [Candidatus Latescibacterota bacterium]
MRQLLSIRNLSLSSFVVQLRYVGAGWALTGVFAFRGMMDGKQGS